MFNTDTFFSAGSNITFLVFLRPKDEGRLRKEYNYNFPSGTPYWKNLSVKRSCNVMIYCSCG